MGDIILFFLPLKNRVYWLIKALNPSRRTESRIQYSDVKKEPKLKTKNINNWDKKLREEVLPKVVQEPVCKKVQIWIPLFSLVRTGS